MDELWDEGAVAGDDAAVGAALLMADLEGAIAAAGDEIASLRRVTEAVPPPGLPPAARELPTAAPEVSGALERTSPLAGVASALRDGVAEQATVEPLARAANEAVANALPERTSVADAPVAALGQTVSARGAASGLRPPAAPVVDLSQALPDVNGVEPVGTELPASAPIGGVPDRLSPSSDQTRSVELTDVPTPISAAPVLPSTAAAEQRRDPEDSPVPEQLAQPLEAGALTQAAPVRSGGSSVREAARVEPTPDRASAGEGVGEAMPPDTSRSGPTEGDVYLDGERVGRWMARHLARELGGPQAAGTGFDPRLGPAWPGALHGN